jgi:quercetin dioxygenase-like cupin family protein
MIKTGDKIENLISGETFVFTKTAADTNGELLQIECTVKPNGRLAAPIIHVHPLQEEYFLVHSGALRVNVEGDERVVGAGESIRIAPGKFHIWSNASETESATFTVELTPALQWELLFESVFTMARDGMTDANGSPSLLRMAVSLHHYPNHFYIQGPPIPVQKVMFALLSPIGRLLGYKPYYPYFESKGTTDYGYPLRG